MNSLIIRNTIPHLFLEKVLDIRTVSPKINETVCASFGDREFVFGLLYETYEPNCDTTFYDEKTREIYNNFMQSAINVYFGRVYDRFVQLDIDAEDTPTTLHINVGDQISLYAKTF